MNRNLTALILIALAVGIYFTVTQGILDQANAVRAVNSQYASAVKNADELIRVRDQVLKEYNGISQDDRDRLDKMIPSTVDNIRLVIDLNSVALQHGFALKNIKAAASDSALAAANVPSSAGQAPGAPVPLNGSDLSISNPTLDTVSISFSVTAPYQQFISFLQDIEANLRIMDVTRLSVRSADSGLYDFNVELKTYWLRQ